MPTILHITPRSAWEKAAAEGSYQPRSLRSQGFIHCSKPDQLIRVANSLFRGRRGLVLLCIDTGKVKPEIRRENLEGGTQLFPHVYGPLNLDAVVRLLDFPPEPDGTFLLPAGLS